jgi:hypothetical protein
LTDSAEAAATYTYTSGSNNGGDSDDRYSAPVNVPPGEGTDINEQKVPLAIANPFEDVDESHWFYEPVMFVYSQGLMKGTSVSPMLFSPNLATTRGMVVTILYRMAENPSVSGLPNPFDDVAADAWYADAVIWAANNGIVAGYGNRKFGPADNITREQMAAILNNYVVKMGLNLPAIRAYTAFDDEAAIAGYAKESVERLYIEGIIDGKKENLFDPKGSSTRAEAASMFHRLVEAIK